MSMDVFTYKYTCPRWYMTYSGTRNIYVQDDQSPEDAALADAKAASGAEKCDVHLLQRFKMVVTDVETYPAMALQKTHRPPRR
tara:strand:+ start:603 stop:851 length:249 start_codon:yes stop_codon:yes gene_type:complete